MIARKIGKQREVEGNAVHASLIEAVRGHFHRHRDCTPGPEPAQQLLELRRVGCGVGCRVERAPQSVAQRAEHRSASSCRVEACRDPMRTGGLAVGAGDADHPQFARGMAVDPIGDAAEAGFQIIDWDMRNLPLAVPAEALHVPENRAGAALDRVGDEAAAVLVRARIGGKDVARAHAPAVGRDAGDRNRQLGEQCRDLGIGRGHDGRRVVHVSSRTSSPSGSSGGWLFGASVGTPSRRSAAPMTLLNTGAATLPP